MGYEVFDIVCYQCIHASSLPYPFGGSQSGFRSGKTNPSPKAEPCLAKPLASQHIKRAQKFFSAVFAFSTFYTLKLSLYFALVCTFLLYEQHDSIAIAKEDNDDTFSQTEWSINMVFRSGGT